jgi:hypothetical protein
MFNAALGIAILIAPFIPIYRVLATVDAALIRSLVRIDLYPVFQGESLARTDRHGQIVFAALSQSEGIDGGVVGFNSQQHEIVVRRRIRGRIRPGIRNRFGAPQSQTDCALPEGPRSRGVPSSNRL